MTDDMDNNEILQAMELALRTMVKHSVDQKSVQVEKDSVICTDNADGTATLKVNPRGITQHPVTGTLAAAKREAIATLTAALSQHGIEVGTEEFRGRGDPEQGIAFNLHVTQNALAKLNAAQETTVANRATQRLSDHLKIALDQAQETLTALPEDSRGAALQTAITTALQTNRITLASAGSAVERLETRRAQMPDGFRIES